MTSRLSIRGGMGLLGQTLGQMGLCLSLAACQEGETFKPAPAGLEPAAGVDVAGAGKGESSSAQETDSSTDSTPDSTPDSTLDQGSGESTQSTPDDLPNPDQGEVPDPTPRICDIDFLFVVDNSKSMGTKQKNLANSVPKFVETLTQDLDRQVNYHLGVVSTDAYPGNPAPCRQFGALITSTQGKKSSNQVCGPYGEGRSYMTREDPIEQHFPCAARPGVEGDPIEKVIDSIRGALSPAMQAPGACNEGFLRKDAILVTVVISDEDDGMDGGSAGSSGEPAQWHQEVMAVKDNDPKKVVMLGLLGQPKPNLCSGALKFSREGKRLTDFMKRFEKQITADVCSPNYDPFFEQALKLIELACDEVSPPI